MAPPMCADMASLGWLSVLVALGAHANFVLLARPLVQSCRSRQYTTHPPAPPFLQVPSYLLVEARCRWRYAFFTYVFIVLLALCIVSDDLLHRRPCLHDSRLFWGLVDNATHSTVALVAWNMASHVSMIPHRMVSSAEGIAAVTVGSLLDADHFVAAHALNLKAATSLNGRPWGHSVTFVMIVVVIAWTALPAAFNRRAAALLFVGLMSHQLRDSFRRGLWFAPIGSTPALPYWLYLVLEVLVPLGVGTWLRSRSRYSPLPSSSTSATPQDPHEINATTMIV